MAEINKRYVEAPNFEPVAPGEHLIRLYMACVEGDALLVYFEITDAGGEDFHRGAYQETCTGSNGRLVKYKKYRCLSAFDRIYIKTFESSGLAQALKAAGIEIPDITDPSLHPDYPCVEDDVFGAMFRAKVGPTGLVTGYGRFEGYITEVSR